MIQLGKVLEHIFYLPKDIRRNPPIQFWNEIVTRHNSSRKCVWIRYTREVIVEHNMKMTTWINV